MTFMVTVPAAFAGTVAVITVFDELTEIEVAVVPPKVNPTFAELPAAVESKLVPVTVITPPPAGFSAVADAPSEYTKLVITGAVVIPDQTPEARCCNIPSVLLYTSIPSTAVIEAFVPPTAPGRFAVVTVGILAEEPTRLVHSTVVALNIDRATTSITSDAAKADSPVIVLPFVA
jgi:hypothetical protein